MFASKYFRFIIRYPKLAGDRILNYLSIDKHWFRCPRWRMCLLFSALVEGMINMT